MAAEADKKPRKWDSGNWGCIFVVFLFVILPTTATLWGMFTGNGIHPDKDATNPKKSLSGFYGIKWGSTQQQARAILQRKGFQFDEKATTERRLIVNGKETENGEEENEDVEDDLRFRGSPPDYLVLCFDGEGFYQTYNFFESADGKSISLPVYDNARYSLGQVYGRPKYETHLLPLNNEQVNQGAENIKSGKVKLKAQWNFKSNRDKQTLTMGVDEDDLAVWVRYRDEKRFANRKTNTK